MSHFIYMFTESFILVVALSLDAFAASFGYGAGKIKIPFSSVLIIAFICSGVLALSLAVGKAVSALIPQHLTTEICFAVLLLLGIYKLFDSTVKSLLRKRRNFKKQISFSAFNLKLILNIYADPEKADYDSSRVLAPAEAISLAFALSFDSLAVGFGASLSDINIFFVLILSIITEISAVLLGIFLGQRVAKRSNIDLSWVCGVLLIVLAVLKFI